MSSSEHHALAEACVALALAAGQVQLEHLRRGVTVATKADRSPVTIADQASERLILAGLAAFAPDVPVVAEEASAAGAVPAIADRFFLVDPLDGTKEFISGNGEFTVNIALIEYGVPVFGLVYAPVPGALYLTLDRRHAVTTTIAADTPPPSLDRLGARPIHVRAPDATALVAIASRSHMNAETEALLARYAIRERRSAGSSLKFCLVAKGEADIYPRIGPTCEWDTAAGHAVLRAAGGDVTTLDGATLTYGKAAQQFRNPDYIAWGAPHPLRPTQPVRPA